MDTNQQPNNEYDTPQTGQPPAASPLTGKRVLIGLAAVIVVLSLVLMLINGKTQNKPTPSPSEITTTAPSQAEEVSPTPPSNGAYANPQLGVQFTYPPQVMVKDVSSDIITVSTIDAPPDPDAPATGMQISIISGNKVADQLELVRDLFKTPVIKDVVINGVAAKEISGYGQGMIEGKFVKFVEIYSGGKTYELSYFEGEPNFTKEDFDQIVASFKFSK